MSCLHLHLTFEDGCLNIICNECKQVWTGVVEKNGATNFTLSSKQLPPFRDTRHDRFVLPIDKK